MTNANVRLYAMTRLRAGDYLLPSNDRETLWRINRYWEDGSLVRSDGKVIRGWFWRAARFVGTMQEAEALMRSDLDTFLDWIDWVETSSLLHTRAEAIGEALRVILPA